MQSTEVLIIGAGPTGLTLACSLAAHNVPVRVVDGAPRPAVTSRANILHARGVEVLDRLGALGSLPEQALAPLGMEMHVQGRPLTTMRFAPVDGESVQALFVSQASVESELRRRLHELGTEVEWGTRLTDLEQDDDGLTARFASGTPLRAAWAVGCDGAHSTVRGLTGIEFPGVPVVEQFLLADVHASWDRDRSTSAGWFHRDGILLAIPMRGTGEEEREDGDLWRLMADVPALSADERLNEQQIIDRFEQIIPVRSGDGGVEIRDAQWTSVFRIHRRLAADYRRGRVLLAGDAAHIHSPIGGQGMNTGIGDAENLGWKLALVAAGRADTGLLDTYTAERRPLATEVLANTTANTKILVGERAVTRMVRDHLFVPLLNLPAVQRSATRTASQLWVTYRKGPLGEARRGHGPHAGDRVQDLDCRRADGTPTRLHAELGRAWALLVPPTAADPGELIAAARGYLGEHVTVLRPQKPAGEGIVMLVRPDGHLGWQGPAAVADLTRWLTGALGRRQAPV
ncbi:FAD-dependent monooxygenase [Nocardiopsis sediminis]|uniref:FAD-dependent monooxygenase n=1 Tax=Nocardiopsis sediminis TaxID=1778267 RepID=A0ABV8FKT2_9ACTN